jgi:hypothetical protein
MERSDDKDCALRAAAGTREFGKDGSRFSLALVFQSRRILMSKPHESQARLWSGALLIWANDRRSPQGDFGRACFFVTLPSRFGGAPAGFTGLIRCVLGFPGLNSPRSGRRHKARGERNEPRGNESQKILSPRSGRRPIPHTYRSSNSISFAIRNWMNSSRKQIF